VLGEKGDCLTSRQAYKKTKKRGRCAGGERKERVWRRAEKGLPVPAGRGRHRAENKHSRRSRGEEEESPRADLD